MGIDRRAHIAPFGKSLFIDARRQIQIAHFEFLVGRITSEAEWSVSRAEITGSRERVRHARNADIRRQIVARPKLMRNHAPKTWIMVRGAWPVAGKHIMCVAIVIGFALGNLM